MSRRESQNLRDQIADGQREYFLSRSGEEIDVHRQVTREMTDWSFLDDEQVDESRMTN